MKFALAFFVLCFTLTANAIPSFDVTGTAPTNLTNPKEIVFIHGLFVNNKCWDEWLAYFSAAGYKVSAPAWPAHEGDVKALQAQPNAELGNLTFEQVLDYYRAILAAKRDNPPILVGHSLGGLIARILLKEGLGSAAVAIDSAPPKGVTTTALSFWKSNEPSLKAYIFNKHQPLVLTRDQFDYAFSNNENLDTQKSAFEDFAVPESPQVAAGPIMFKAIINPLEARGPLLLIAGGEDHIIPAQLNYDNFKFYKRTNLESNFTQFLVFPYRDHWTIGGPGWEDVALATKNFIEAQMH